MLQHCGRDRGEASGAARGQLPARLQGANI